MSRFNRIDGSSLQLPGKCTSCGAGGSTDDNRKFWDLRIQVPRFGAVYFCDHCAGDLAREMNFVHREQLDIIHHTYKLAEEAENVALAKIGILKDALTIIMADNMPIPADADELVDSVLARLAEPEASSKSPDVAVSPAKGSDKPVSRQGSKRVRSTSADPVNSNSDDLDVSDLLTD